MSRSHRIIPLTAACVLAITTALPAQQRRATPPVYREGQFRGIFERDLSQLVTSDRPRIDRLQGAGPAPIAPATATANANAGGAGAASAESGGMGQWRALADPVHLEDEVKRLKLHYDSVVTTAGRFKSGDFQTARLDLSVLATLMAVISEYEGDIRFKEDAAVARELFARSATGVASGSSEAFTEARQRKADLQDLVSGGGMNRSDPTGPTDWSVVAGRSPLMKYLQSVLDSPLQSGSNDAASVEQNLDDLKRAAAMVAVIGEVLKQEGMDDAEDAEYREFADAMRQAALDLRAALAEQDAEAARLAVGQISQSCSACHDNYR